MDLDRFKFREFFDRKSAELATEAALIESAKAELRVTVHKGVYPDRAGSNAAADRKGRIDVPGPNPGRKPIDGIVGDPNRLFGSVKSQDR